MSETHLPMSPALINKILKVAEEKPPLSDFEKALVNDRLGAIKKFGTRAVATPKQITVLNKLFFDLQTKRRVSRVEFL